MRASFALTVGAARLLIHYPSKTASGTDFKGDRYERLNSGKGSAADCPRAFALGFGAGIGDDVVAKGGGLPRWRR
jgi:hypothetical protein